MLITGGIVVLLMTARLCTSASDPQRLATLLDNQDIHNTWNADFLRMCIDAAAHQPSPMSALSCHRLFNAHRLFVDVEVLNEKPAVLRLPRFGDLAMTSAIRRAYKHSHDVESQRVEGHAYSAGHRGRVADGLWLEHNEPPVRPLFERLQETLRLNPAIGENFLILGYKQFGHYAPHFDHLQRMSRHYDGGWFEFYGNRVATALFIVEAATGGGGTVFPRLNLTVMPQEGDSEKKQGTISVSFAGDLLLWVNADSNDELESLSLHAACPIEKGEKLAVSLWLRGRLQDELQSSLNGAHYETRHLIRDRLFTSRFKTRPSIELSDKEPTSVGFDYDSD